MAFPIGAHVVINDLTNQAAAAGTVVGYTTFEADTPYGEVLTTRHYYVVELEDEHRAALERSTLFIQHVIVHEDHLRRSAADRFRTGL